MSAILAALFATALAQAPAPQPTTCSQVVDAVVAARRAADAAEKAAQAAERSAKAAEELARASAAQAPAEGAAPVPVPAPTPKSWSAAVGLSLIAMTGNSESLTFSLTGTAERRTEHWVLSGKLAAAYGQSRVVEATQPEIVAEAASAQLRVDRKLTQTAAGYLLAQFDTDHVKSLEARYTGELGAALTWWERKEGAAVTSLLRTDLGMRFSQEARFQYFPTRAGLPGVTMIAPTVGLGFRYGLTAHLALVEEAQVSWNVWGASRLLASSLTRLTARLTDGLLLTVALQVAQDSFPAPGKKPTDAIFSAGVDLTF